MVSVDKMALAKKNEKALDKFAGFPPGGLKFLAALKKNNRREWFQPRKEEFESLLQVPLVQLATQVNDMMHKTAPEYAFADPAKSLNRIYRDVRFSADKSPYQTHVSILFPEQRLGKKVGAALYFGLSPADVTVAGGMYFGDTRQLQAVREHIAAKHQEFRKILAAKLLKQEFGDLKGECLQKTPKQFGVDHPAADLLKHKQWLLYKNMPTEAALNEKFGDEVVKAFRAAMPFIRFLNEPLKALPVRSVEEA